MAEISRRLFLGVTGSGLAVAAGLTPSAARADAPSDVGTLAESDATVTVTATTVTLTNDVMRVALGFSGGSLRLTSLFNREAAQEYQTNTSGRRLFSYEIDATTQIVADDGGWTISAPVVTPIVMFTVQGQRTVGQMVNLVMRRTTPKPMTVTAVFELYNGRSGLRFRTLIRNDNTSAQVTITRSVVLALAITNQAHTIHYVPNMIWRNTRGALSPLPADTSSSAKRAELPKKAVTVYDAGHGWSISPELNWKTLRGRGTGTDVMLPPFASIDLFSGVSHVQVITNPTALQLVLFPREEFEYLSVNVTVFKGGIVEGKMAEQEHFRKRFRYNNTSTLMHTNDFDYRAGPGRTLPASYYYTTIIPKALAAGLDMVMLDDLWNTTRDTIQPSAAMNQSIRSLAEFSKTLADRGLLFGLWFSLTGGGHGQGRDLGDPAMRMFKRSQIETLITQFRMTHQMIDLTEYWQTETVTAWSHPSDSVFRKNMLIRRMMNELVTAHPQLLPKMTSELDIFPTQGDRNNGLMHVCNNGWNTANGGVTGENLSLRTALTGFGHLPMESSYMNIGRVTGKMEDYYSYMAVRAVKFGQDPGITAQWPQAGITLLATFNRWRKSPRVRALTEQLFRPVYLGTGWDSTNWNSATGPYVWMYTDVDRTRALVIATGSGGTATGVQANLRWLSDTSTYMISDITLADNGSHSYAYRGTFLGSTLKANRFPIDLRMNPSRGKAFWVERVAGTGLQVQYADEFVTSWTTTAGTGQVTIQVTGQANTTATLIVVDPAANRGLVRTVQLNGQGTGTTTVRAVDLVPPQPVSTTFGDPVLLQADELSRTLVPATVGSTEISDGNASNGQWIRADFTATGQRIEYAVDVPEKGMYEIEVRFNENTDRGRSQPYLDGRPLGPELNHCYPGQVYQGVEFRERRLGVRALTAGRHTLAFESTGTDGTSLAVGVDNIVLTPTLARDRVVVELENVWAASSKPCDLIADPAASPARNGTCQDLAATGVGDWVDYRVTVPTAGSYRIATMVQRHVARGQFQLQVDGQPLGEVVDLHLPTSDGDYQYAEIDHGTVSFDSPGEKMLRYDVVGRNEDSSSFRLVIDYVAVTSVPSMTITAPKTINVGQQVQLQAGTDLGSYADPRLLLWSVDDADSGAAAFIDDAGRIAGREPGTAVVRVRSQVDPAVSASRSITVQSATKTSSIGASSHRRPVR